MLCKPIEQHHTSRTKINELATRTGVTSRPLDVFP
jgi:hypothetical protein